MKMIHMCKTVLTPLLTAAVASELSPCVHQDNSVLSILGIVASRILLRNLIVVFLCFCIALVSFCKSSQREDQFRHKGIAALVIVINLEIFSFCLFCLAGALIADAGVVDGYRRIIGLGIIGSELLVSLCSLVIILEPEIDVTLEKQSPAPCIFLRIFCNDAIKLCYIAFVSIERRILLLVCFGSIRKIPAGFAYFEMNFRIL